MRCKVHVILHPESIKFLQLCNASTGLNDLNCVEGSSSQVIRVWHVMELSTLHQLEKLETSTQVSQFGCLLFSLDGAISLLWYKSQIYASEKAIYLQ